ncbi:MAG: cysteine synthase [Gemmatimonadales bacterium]|nr:cysteine synthase [Gemmatimonadales bacterium]
MESEREQESISKTADLTELVIAALSHLASSRLATEHQPFVPSEHSPSDLRRELGIALAEHGSSLEELVHKLERILAATPSSSSRRFFNQLFGGRDPAGLLAEMLTPLANSSMYTYKVAGPAVLIEREVIARALQKLGYLEGEGMFSPGGSLSNLTAMLIARNEKLGDVRETGLEGRGQRLTVYLSDQGHYSIRKSAGMLGLGRNNVRLVPTDANGSMDRAAARHLIERDRRGGATPFMLVATTGTTVLGAFDPITELADLAREFDMWLHVDGAFGGSVMLCDEYRHLIEGAGRSDSFTWNAHKMMGVPLSCSMLLVSRRGLLRKHLDEPAEYLFQSDDTDLDPGRRSIQCGRRNDALKLWAAWQLHGDAGFARRIERQFAVARRFTSMIENDPELILAKPPQSINVCFRVKGKSSRDICTLLDRTGRLKIGFGTVDGRDVIRMVCVNPDVAERDLRTVLEEIKSAAAELPPTSDAPAG